MPKSIQPPADPANLDSFPLRMDIFNTALFFQVSVKTLQRMVADGRMGPKCVIRLPGRGGQRPILRFDREACRKWLEACSR